MLKQGYRQGDIYLRPPRPSEGGKLPKEAKKVDTGGKPFVLAEGEATGHTHTMSTETMDVFQVEDRFVLVTEETTMLKHQTHGDIEVVPDVWWVVPQREYSPEGARRVID